MPTNHYDQYISISPTFESVVDIDADQRNGNLWREYIVGEDMENLMNFLCQSINNEAPDARRSFWMEGTYGTGKSYAAIVTKHLMEEAPAVVDDYLTHNQRLLPFRNRFMKARKDRPDYLVVWKTGCTGIRDGNALLMEMEKAVREALAAKFGDRADYGESSLHDAVRAQVHNNEHNWDVILENSILGDSYSSADELTAAIDAGSITALKQTAKVIREKGWGLINSLDTFKAWITSVIENNHLEKSGIFFIWDEFTEYISNSDDVTLLQQISEFCKVKPFFALFVMHRTSEAEARITPQRYQLITQRFHRVEFHISNDAAYDLISNSISVESILAEHWKDARKSVVQRIKPFLPEMVGLDDHISEMIDKLCPMHPMTIKLLSRVSENYAASQRTMFRFMKDQTAGDQGFAGYIKKYGPDDLACWLTPDWLWDYFFTRESDFTDKDSKAAAYIRHFDENKRLFESDENALRVFKTAMLLMALMSTSTNLYIGKRSKDGIAATAECLATCLAGVTPKETVLDLLHTMQDDKAIMLDEDRQHNLRLQLPFKGTSEGEFEARYADLDRKNSRYMMFSKDGVFAQAFEKHTLDDNDPFCKRLKLATCCAETNSIKARLDEVTKELTKCPHKLGLLVVVVDSENQYVAVQEILKSKVREAAEPRLTIALLRKPLTEEQRKAWLTSVTKQELAVTAGNTGAANQYRTEAETLVAKWVGEVAGGSKIIAYNGDQVFNGLYGMSQLRSTIRINVMDALYPYAPENIVPTNTAYKTCNEGAPMAGVQRTTNNSQLKNVLVALKNAGILECTDISAIAAASGSKAADAVAALAKLVRDEMESGSKVSLSDLWDKLRQAPFGYYDNIACGVILGFVFSCYKNSKYTWTDSVQAPHVLAEATLGKLVVQMCKGRMSTDYLSAGSITWQNFSEYLLRIFGLKEEQLAEQTSGCQNVREAIIKAGIPFWALKHLPDTAWNNAELQESAAQVIDDIQTFITQNGDIEAAMSDALQRMHGNKIRVTLEKAFKDKEKLAVVFRDFLFKTSPELQEIVTKLGIPSQELSDKLHRVMQGAIYTWTEEEVAAKLDDVVHEYRYLEALNSVLESKRNSVEDARRDFVNLFKLLRISLAAIEKLNKPWYPALQALHKLARGEAAHMTQEERDADIQALTQYGTHARDCLKDAKPVLSDIIAAQNVDCTEEELALVFAGLKDLSCETSLTQFEKELKNQLSRINQTRNKTTLLTTWKLVTGEETTKDWCVKHKTPLLWIVSDKDRKHFEVISAVQRNAHTLDSDVVSAIQFLKQMDSDILTNNAKIHAAFLQTVGTEYADIWQEVGAKVLTQVKTQQGNDMSTWSTGALSCLQRLLKAEQQAKAKREKLSATKDKVQTMDEATLRSKVAAFLDQHPEFCDFFAK